MLAQYFSRPEQRQQFQGLIETLRAGRSINDVLLTAGQPATGIARSRSMLQGLEALGILWRENARGTAPAFEDISSDDAKLQARFGEMIEYTVEAARLGLEQRSDKQWLHQQEVAQPGYLKYHYSRLEQYCRSDDIPSALTASLRAVTEQLKAAWQQHEQARTTSPFETGAIKQSPDYSSQRVEPRAAGSDEWTGVTNPAVEQMMERTESYLLETDDTPWQHLGDDSAVTAKLQELQQYREFVTNGAAQLDSSRAVVDRLQGRRGPDLTPEQFDHWLQQIVGPDVGRTKVSPDRLQELREYISGGVSRDIERAGELRLRQEKPSSLLKKSGIWLGRLAVVGGIIEGSFAVARLNQQFSARRDLLGWRKAVLSFFRNQEHTELLSRRHEVARNIFQVGKELDQPALLDVAVELERLNLYELNVPTTRATT